LHQLIKETQFGALITQGTCSNFHLLSGASMRYVKFQEIKMSMRPARDTEAYD